MNTICRISPSAKAQLSTCFPGLIASRSHPPSRQRLLISKKSSLRPTLVKAESGEPSGGQDNEGEYTSFPEENSTWVGTFFGSYLQLGVWIVVLSFAGYKGFQQAQTDPQSVGLLLAPPAGALFLIVSFLLYRFFGKKDED